MASATPTVAPPQPASLSRSLERNIRSLAGRRQQEVVSATPEERIADGFTSCAGSMKFVYLHTVLFGAWILINLGLIPGVPQFDLTKLAGVINAVAVCLDVKVGADPEMDEIKRNVAPEAVLDAVETERKNERKFS